MLDAYVHDRSHQLSERTIGDYSYFITRHFPFAKRDITKISSAEIRQHLDELRDRPSLQRHAFTALRAFLNWAEQREIITQNPIGKVPTPPPQKSRDRVLTDPELAEVFSTAKSYPFPFGHLMQMLVLLGQRRGETAAMEWEWINFDEREIVFPASITKNRTEHVVPLMPTALRVLSETPRTTRFVFPASKTKSGEPAAFNGWCQWRPQIPPLGRPHNLQLLRFSGFALSESV